jgi:hypothetical protein
VTPKNKAALWVFVPETLLYGAFTAGFCFGVVRFLSRPLEAMFKGHRVEYGLLALALMIFQGFALERLTHWICELLRRRRKARA